MVDAAAAASEMRKIPICLPLAKSNVSICHPPQDRTMVFIKINILCTQQCRLFIFIYLFIYIFFFSVSKATCHYSLFVLAHPLLAPQGGMVTVT